MINTFTSYNLITRDLPGSIGRIEAQPMVSRETEYFRANIENVKSIEDLVADDRLFRYAMKAHGLEDMAYAKAFMVRAMREGVEDRDSFANKLTDKRYRDFVATFDFARYGEEATQRSEVTVGTVHKYLRQTLEEEAGRQNEGVRLALYFQRKAPLLKNFYEVLADPALARVVRTALGFPETLAQADIDKQVQMFKERLDIEDFQDDGKLDDFLKRFTTMWEVANPSFNPQNSIAALFTRPAEFGISTDVLMTIAQMRR